jgi:alpha-beta hydrolase superfamily lysophospholipase/SAM-dependent methyltransferase
MTPTSLAAWQPLESGFDSFDAIRLFYRAWRPLQPVAGRRPQALVFLHRGHEHSGRIAPLVAQFGMPGHWAFAHDARGHGHSPGARGDAPSFGAMVQDFEAFVRHIEAQHGVATEDMLIVANSVGAVIAATWLHDYAPRVRGVVMAAAAFDINLYVPLAKPALRLGLKLNPGLNITSYIKSGMLTHSREQAAAYDADPLITRNISARVLLDLADTAERIVADAEAIDTPVLMLAAEKDYVVKEAPQRLFFGRLSSKLKRYLRIPNCHHAIFYEDAPQAEAALQAARDFAAECFVEALPPLASYRTADTDSASARTLLAMQQGRAGSPLENAWYGLQKNLLGRLGHLSQGMVIGMAQGFDSGASLDYVYRNQAAGRLGIGKSIDRGYLDAIGWRGIRLRKTQLQHLLGGLIAAAPAGQPLRILDIAAGGGRYVLETLKRFQECDIEVTLRDLDAANLAQAEQLAMELQLKNHIAYQRRDAFDEASYPAEEVPYDIVVVSGLYELFADNTPVLRSLSGIARQLKPGGHLVYTGQPWHPQLLLIAATLNNHRGEPWRMRPRPQAEMDGLVAGAGFKKLASAIGLAGIFTVSVARLESPAATRPEAGSPASMRAPPEPATTGR